MKKIILIVGGIIIVATAGRLMWAYQQVKNDETKLMNVAAPAATPKEIPVGTSTSAGAVTITKVDPSSDTQWAGGVALYGTNMAGATLNIYDMTNKLVQVVQSPKLTFSADGSIATFFTYDIKPGSYQLRVEAPAGQSNALPFTIIDSVPLTPEITLTALPASVVSGGSTAISWSTKNADSCVMSSTNAQLGTTTGPAALEYKGTTYGPLTSPLTFKLTCRSVNGKSTTQSLVVKISSRGAQVTSTANHISPKETFLAMAIDFSNVLKLGGSNPFKDAQSIAPVYKSSEFKQFVDKYLIKNVVLDFETKSDPQKAWFVLGLAMTVPDSSSKIKESVRGSSAMVSYNNTYTATSKNGGQGDNLCALLTLDNNMWKMDPDKSGDCTNL